MDYEYRPGSRHPRLIPEILQVLSAIIRVRDHSSATAPPLSPTHGRRAAHEELRVREAGSHGVEHRGPALRLADPQRERAEPAGRERARRRLLVGLACRGLPKGAPRVIRPVDPPIPRGTVSPVVFTLRDPLNPLPSRNPDVLPSRCRACPPCRPGADGAVLPCVATSQAIAIGPSKSEQGGRARVSRSRALLSLFVVSDTSLAYLP